MNTPALLNMYELGNVIGYYSAAALGFLFIIIWIWVMFRYLNTKDLKG